MTLLYGHSKEVEKFVGQLMQGGERGFGACSAIGVLDKEGRLIGGMVFHDWSPETETIEITVASNSRRWVTREMLRAQYHYVFEQLGCQMAIHRTFEYNQHVRRAVKAIGATEYVIANGSGRGKDLYLLTLTDEEWKNSKFMRQSHGKTQRTRAA